MKRLLIAGSAVALVAVLVIGLTQAGSGGSAGKSAEASCASAAKGIQGAPAAVASLHREACRLLPGGPAAFKARLASLRGHPVVVNKWASWCAPCRTEFPLFQKAARDLGAQVAFVGVNSNDNNGDAAAFLKRYPVAYPSYEDPSGTVAQVFNASIAFPTTAFYDASGKMTYLHQGQYQSAAKLLADVKRYAG